MDSQAPGDLHPALSFSLSTSHRSKLQTELADDAAAEAHGHSVRTRARLKLCQEMPYVRFHGFLRKEQPFADLAVHETVGDELQHFDLPARRLLLELAKRALERNHLRTAGTTTPRRNFLEAARVRQITAEDLLALSCVHGSSIGRMNKAL